MRITVKIPQKLLKIKSRFYQAMNRASLKIEDIGLKGIQNSIKKRWFRTGNSLNKVTSQRVDVSPEKKEINFISGTNYDIFGEYGTGKRGSSSQPEFTPSGWVYGTSIMGMDSRFMFHTGIEEVLPEINEKFVSEMMKAL